MRGTAEGRARAQRTVLAATAGAGLLALAGTAGLTVALAPAAAAPSAAVRTEAAPDADGTSPVTTTQDPPVMSSGGS